MVVHLHYEMQVYSKYVCSECVYFEKTEESSILSCLASNSSNIQREKATLQELFIYMHTCNISIFSPNLARDIFFY